MCGRRSTYWRIQKTWYNMQSQLEFAFCPLLLEQVTAASNSFHIRYLITFAVDWGRLRAHRPYQYLPPSDDWAGELHLSLFMSQRLQLEISSIATLWNQLFFIFICFTCTWRVLGYVASCAQYPSWMHSAIVFSTFHQLSVTFYRLSTDCSRGL